VQLITQKLGSELYYYGIKLRTMRKARHVARMKKIRRTHKIFIGSLNVRYYLRDLIVDERIILNSLILM
jgi:hypothetical protein